MLSPVIISNEVLYNQLETTQPKNNADEYLNIDIKSAMDKVGYDLIKLEDANYAKISVAMSHE